jgi:hypothetical protein
VNEKMKTIASVSLSAVALLGAACGNNAIDRIAGTYELEVGTTLCHGLDLKSLTIEKGMVIIKGGGSTKFIDSISSMGGDSPESIRSAKENNRKHAEGIKASIKAVAVVDRTISRREWDAKALKPNDVLFTKAYTITWENGKSSTVYSDEKQRIGLSEYEKCIFRR